MSWTRPLALGCTLLLASCVPDFGGLSVVDRDGDALDGGGTDASAATDGAAGRDAGSTDAASLPDSGGRDAGPSPDGLPTGSCRELFSEVYVDEDFSGPTTQFTAFAGALFLESGELVMDLPNDSVLLGTAIAFPDVLACAEVRMSSSSSVDMRHAVNIGLRGMDHGITFSFQDGDVELIAIEPVRNRLMDSKPYAWAGEHRFRLVIYYNGTRGYAHLQDLDSGATETLRGAYFGDDAAVGIYFEADELASRVYIDHVIGGAPTAAILPLLEGSGG